MPKPAEYHLKSGEILHLAGTADYYVNDVQTTIAEAFLKKFPAKITMFDRFPENWETRLKKTTKSAVKEQTSETTAAEETK